MQIDKLLFDILSVQSASYHEERMIFFITEHCKENGYNVTVNQNNVYVTKGDATMYPCYVAHTDTCASILPDNQFKVVSVGDDNLMGYNYIKNDFTQVGFDDKIGIYIALKMLLEIPYGKAFFPHAEEVGCVGTAKALMEFFDDCQYLIQCDRRNSKGIVQSVYGTPLFGEDFKQVLTELGKPYERTLTTGMLTDVYTLKNKGLKVACTNLECGYYNPHRDDDYCSINEVMATFNFVKDIYTNSEGIVFHHEYVKPVYNYPAYPTYPRYNRTGPAKTILDYEDWYADYVINDPDDPSKEKNKLIDFCEACYMEENLERHNKTGLFLCSHCLKTYGNYFSGYTDVAN